MADRLQSRLAKLGPGQQSQLEALGFDTNRSRRRLPPLQTLVAFESAARLESFTLAANELNITQPAVSQQVRLLEERLGFALFERSNNRVAVTHQGEQLAQAVTALLDDLTDSIDEARNEAARAVVTISLLPSFASTWFAARAGRFEVRNPDIDLIIYSTVACTEFGQEDADLALRWGMGGWDQYYEEKLMGERFIAVASPALVKQLGGVRTMDDLASVPLVHDAGFSEWHAFLRANNGDPDAFSSGLYFGDSSATATTILAGHGFGIVRDVLVDHLLSAGHLVELPFKSVPGPRSYHFMCPRKRLHRPEVQALLTWLRGEAEGDAKTPA